VKHLAFSAILATLLVTLVGNSGQARRNDEANKDNPPAEPKFIDQGATDKQLAGLAALEGFRLEVVTVSPTVNAPTQLLFDEKGVPYVVEGRGSRLLRLSSSKQDGNWDTARVIFDQVGPATPLFYDGWLYRIDGGKVVRHKLGEQLGAAETLVEGIGGRSAARAGGLTVGPDGWIYFGIPSGNHMLRGKDGGKVVLLATGGLIRCRPDGTGVEIVARGLTHPRGAPFFDSLGTLFQIDGGLAANPQTRKKAGIYGTSRLLQVVEGVDFGWRETADGQIDSARVDLATIRPGTVAATSCLATATSLDALVYNDVAWPEDYRGLMLDLEPATGHLRGWPAFSRTPILLLRRDNDHAVRPFSLSAGPDGAVYVLARSMSEGQKSSTNLICRLRWAGTTAQPEIQLRKLDCLADLGKRDDKQLLAALSSPIGRERDLARYELVRRGDRNRAALIELFKGEDSAPHTRLAALGVLRSMVNNEVIEACIWGIQEGDAEVQLFAADALGRLGERGNRRIQDVLLKALALENGEVRRAIVLAMGKLAGPGAADNLASALAFDSGKDRLVFDGYLRALESLGKPGIDALLALGDSGRQRDTDRMVEAFCGLRERVAFDAMVRLLGNPHISSDQQAQIIRSARNFQLDPPVSLDAVATYLAKQGRVSEEVDKAFKETKAVLNASQQKAK